MDVQELLSQVTDKVTVSRVFGEPIQHGEVLMVPVARVRGGAGGGTGTSPKDDSSGSGGGAGFNATPAGVYVVKNNNVTWQPAVDVNKIVAGAQVVAVVMALVIRAFLKRR